LRVDTLESAFIKIAERECGGEAVFQRGDGSVWRCEAWRLSVRGPEGDGEALVVKLEEDGIKIRIDP
jgi:hypothetical protein